VGYQIGVLQNMHFIFQSIKICISGCYLCLKSNYLLYEKAYILICGQELLHNCGEMADFDAVSQVNTIHSNGSILAKQHVVQIPFFNFKNTLHFLGMLFV
jgi:hypothetical protein